MVGLWLSLKHSVTKRGSLVKSQGNVGFYLPVGCGCCAVTRLVCMGKLLSSFLKKYCAAWPDIEPKHGAAKMLHRCVLPSMWSLHLWLVSEWFSWSHWEGSRTLALGSGACTGFYADIQFVHSFGAVAIQHCRLCTLWLSTCSAQLPANLPWYLYSCTFIVHKHTLP